MQDEEWRVISWPLSFLSIGMCLSTNISWNWMVEHSQQLMLTFAIRAIWCCPAANDVFSHPIKNWEFAAGMKHAASLEPDSKMESTPGTRLWITQQESWNKWHKTWNLHGIEASHNRSRQSQDSSLLYPYPFLQHIRACYTGTHLCLYLLSIHRRAPSMETRLER